MVAVNYIVNWVDPEVGVSFRVKDTFAVPVVLATVGPASTGVAVHAALPTLAPAMVVVTQL